MKQFAGKWRIVEMELWEQDYEDLEVPGFIHFAQLGPASFSSGW